MSINKSITLPNDVVVGFWKVQTVIVYSLDKKMIVSFAGYVSEDSFNGGKEKVLERSIEVPIDNIPGLSDVLSFCSDKVSQKLGEENP